MNRATQLFNEQISFLQLLKSGLILSTTTLSPHLPIYTDQVWYEEVMNRSHVLVTYVYYLVCCGLAAAVQLPSEQLRRETS